MSECLIPQDSPPPLQEPEAMASEPSAAAAEKPPQRAEAPSSFGMRARPVKIIHKKRKVEPDAVLVAASVQKKAADEGASGANGAGAASNGAADGGGGLLGLGSYGSESE